MYTLLLIIIILLFLYLIKTKNLLPQKTESPESEPINENLQLDKLPYTKKMLLTKTEYSFYQILKSECDKADMLICPKVRLEDFINVTDKKNYSKYRGYIKSRHIDFLLCNSKLQIIGAIELDDNTHNTAKAKKTDEFKNNLFNTINLPLFRIKTSDSDYKKQISNILVQLQTTNTQQNNTNKINYCSF